ncbi:hypothetical protein ACFSTC_58790 [Nonomuraea ferruginea]
MNTARGQAEQGLPAGLGQMSRPARQGLASPPVDPAHPPVEQRLRQQHPDHQHDQDQHRHHGVQPGFAGDVGEGGPDEQARQAGIALASRARSAHREPHGQQRRRPDVGQAVAGQPDLRHLQVLRPHRRAVTG